MSQAQALIADKAELFKKIDAWGARGKKWAEEGHTIAMSALTMFSKHNDIGPVNRVLTAMPKGTKVTGMVSWFLTHGALRQNDGDNAKEQPLVYTKDKVTNLEAAAQDPWYNHKPESATDQVFDLQKALERILVQAKGKELVHGELLTGVQSLLSMVKTVEKVTDADQTEGDDTTTE